MRLPWTKRQAPPERAVPQLVISPDERPQAAVAAAPDPRPDAIVQMLGPFTLTLAGTPVRRWTSLKGLTILKYLLMHGRRARREDLMELLWPGFRPDSARNNLNVAIYALRRDFETAGIDVPVLLYADGSYALSGELEWWIDVYVFEAAIAAAAVAGDDRPAAMDAYLTAVGLYRGPLLEDEAHGEWHHDEQRVLQERYLAASEALAEIYLDDGEVGEAVEMGETVLRTDPCRESTHRLLMRCFALQHQGQLIARQFRRCAEALDREVGLRPDRETVRLFRELTDSG